MKKNSVLLLLSNLFLFTQAQLLTPYIQAEAGAAVNHQNMYTYRTELGVSYKWLDVGLMKDNESNFFFKEYNGKVHIYKDEGYNPGRNHNKEFDYYSTTSLQLVVKIDVIRLFTTDSRHAFKIGGGFGVANYKDVSSNRSFKESSSVEYALEASSRYGLLGSFKAGYEYEIMPKLKVGAFFGGTFYPAVALSLRKDF